MTHPSQLPDPEPPRAGLFAAANRLRAALKARGAYVVLRPDHSGGGPLIGGTAIPTEAVASLFGRVGSIEETAAHYRISEAQVWAALWFEAGVDSRRRYHL